MRSSIYCFYLTVYFKCNRVFSVLPCGKWEKNSKKPFLLAVKNAAIMLFLLLLFIYISVDHNLNCGMSSISVQIFHLGNVLSLLLCISYLKHLDMNRNTLERLVELVEQVKRNYNLHPKWITASMIHFVMLHISVGVFFTSTSKAKNSLHGAILYLIQTVGFYYEYLGANTFLLLNLVIIDKLLQINAILKQLRHFQPSGLSSIKNAKRLYISIVDITRSLNEYFGVKILLTFGNNLCRVLWLLFVLIQNSNDKSIRLDWSTFSATLIHIIVGMLPVYITTTSCANITRHTRFISARCYQMQFQFEHDSYERRELEALWHFIMENPPCYLAMGFFEVQPRTMLGVFAAAITYFVALLQFK